MANQGAGTVSGYRSHGPERRADAGHAHPASLGGSPMVRVPFRDVRPLGEPAKLDLTAEARGLGRAVVRGARVSRAIQRGQQPHGGSGMTWTAAPVPSSVPQASGSAGWTWAATAGPAYGGAAYNGGGGDLANAMSNGDGGPARQAAHGGPYRAIAGPSYPGERVTSKPPTTMRQSQAGRSRRAQNFRKAHNGPKIIQGTALPPDEA